MPITLERQFQNAYVTHDLEKAVAIVKAKYGINDYVYFTPDIEVNTPRGRGRSVVKVALAWAGNYQIEIIEPVSGMVDHYLPYLPADKSDPSLRFHHTCMRVDDMGVLRKQLAEENWVIAYEGGVPGVEFVYVDARESVGHYLEYLWSSPEMWTAMGGK